MDISYKYILSIYFIPYDVWKLAFFVSLSISFFLKPIRKKLWPIFNHLVDCRGSRNNWVDIQESFFFQRFKIINNFFLALRIKQSRFTLGILTEIFLLSLGTCCEINLYYYRPPLYTTGSLYRKHHQSPRVNAPSCLPCACIISLYIYIS